jgi:hypothetical protein
VGGGRCVGQLLGGGNSPRQRNTGEGGAAGFNGGGGTPTGSSGPPEEGVVAASLAKFCGEAAAPSDLAGPMGLRGWREVPKRIQGGRDDGEERGGVRVGVGTPRGRGRRKERRGRCGVGSRTLQSGRLRVVLSEAAVHAHSGGGLANWGGRRGTGVTDRRDRGEAGPDGHWPRYEREREREVGWQWGADMWAQAAQCQVAWFKPLLNRLKI